MKRASVFVVGGALLVELAAYALAILIAWWLGSHATSAWLARVAKLGVNGPDADAVRNAAWSEFDPTLHVTMSIGLCESSDFGDSSELVRRADESLYAAKHAGRDRVHLWTASGL
jgi:predicted signal transduction protein with EAL and GGDEF domain